jgi:hypothetical protein
MALPVGDGRSLICFSVCAWLSAPAHLQTSASRYTVAQSRIGGQVRKVVVQRSAQSDGAVAPLGRVRRHEHRGRPSTNIIYIDINADIRCSTRPSQVD